MKARLLLFLFYILALPWLADASVVSSSWQTGHLGCYWDTGWKFLSQGSYIDYVSWKPGSASGDKTETTEIQISYDGGYKSSQRDQWEGWQDIGINKLSNQIRIKAARTNDPWCAIENAKVFYRYCSPSSVSNGIVVPAPNCTITCNSGYKLSGTSCIKSDNSAPLMSVNKPSGTYASPLSYTATWSDSGKLDRCEIRFGVIWYSAGGCSNSTKHTYSGSFTFAGSHWLQLRAWDISGNYAYSSIYSYTIANPPTADLKANSSNGPVSIDYSASATLSWISTNATSCTASNGWSGSKGTSGSQSTGALTASKTYTLTCSGTGGSASDSVMVNVKPRPTADIKANSSNGPIYVAYNTAATLSWSSTNAVGCEASGDWSGGKGISGSESTGKLLSGKTYYLRCNNASGSYSSLDQVTVNVTPRHTVCSGNACVLQSGAGVNACFTNCTSSSSCGGTGGGGSSGPNWHSVCTNNACVVADGAGTNECSTNFDCGGSAYPSQYYGVCAQGACVMVEGTPSTCTAAGVSPCSNYGGNCPNPTGSSYNLSISGDLRINITKDAPTACSTSATILVVEPLVGFSAPINLSINDWDGVTGGTAEFSDSMLTSDEYDDGSELTICVPQDITSGNYDVVIRGEGGGKVIDRAVRVIVHNLADSSWREI